MSAYLKVIQRLAKENGIELAEKDIQEMAAAIDGMDADNIDKVTAKFSKFANTISGSVDTKID
jgi:hypothetical protein